MDSVIAEEISFCILADRNLPPLNITRIKKGRFMSQVNNTLNQGLIAIYNNTVNGQSVETVNARELHAFLESKQEFANWIKDRINQYDFIENQDFAVFDKIIKNPQGGRPTKDYALSLDMAKQISMVERNEQGKKARQYFIECEKRAKQAPTPALPALPQNFEQALQALLDSVREKAQIEATKNAIIEEQHKQLDNKDVVIHAQTKEITYLKPKSELFDMFTVANNGLHFRESANILTELGAKINDKRLSIKTFPQWLRDNNYLMAETKIVGDKGDYVLVKGEKWNQPYQKYQHLFHTETISFRKPDGKIGLSSQTTLKIEGIIYFAKKLGVDSDALSDYLRQKGLIKDSELV